MNKVELERKCKKYAERGWVTSNVMSFILKARFFLKNNLVTAPIMRFLSWIVSFFRAIRVLVKDMIIDKLSKYEKETDIRLVYLGYIWGHKGVTNQDWFFMFIESLTNQKVAVSWYKPSLIISSVFTNYSVLKCVLKFSKVPSLFFSPENLNLRFLEYKNYLNDLPDLALGFDYDSPYARRFPLWLQYIFTGDFVAKASIKDIRDKLKEIENSSFLNKRKFASMIARHDGLGAVSRSEIVQALDTMYKVSCAGRFLHNDDTLVDKFNDNKKEYLKDFVFNICPENTASTGYVTEKIFESFEAGCIPIYWGDSNPEPDILNPKRIIFWQKDSDNKENLQLIKEIYENKEKREKLLKEPVFIEDADKVIYNYFLMLRGKMAALLNKQ